MKSRLPVAALSVILAGLLALLAWSLGAQALTVSLTAFIGLIVGAVLGQSLMWARASVGRVSRIEVSTAKRLEEMRTTNAKRHELVYKAARDARDRATSAEREAKAAAEVVPRVEVALTKQRNDERADLRELRLSLIDHVDDQAVLLEDYMQLIRLVPMPLPMPRPGTWAASEDLLLWLAGFVLEHRPRVVLDLGSGQSSVWMAAAMRTAGHGGRVIGVDHDEAYAQATRDLARRQGVSDWLTVVHAPLREQEFAGRAATWYDVDALGGITDIELLSIDGPPGQGTAQARWAALPALHECLAPAAVVVLDDMIRHDEQEILDDWLARFPDFAVERLAFEKGAAVMRRGSSL